jgi:hypothetical protein
MAREAADVDDHDAERVAKKWRVGGPNGPSGKRATARKGEGRHVSGREMKQ